MGQHTTYNPIQGLTTTVGTATPVTPAVMADCTYDGASYKITYSDGWTEVGGYNATSITAYGSVSVSFGDTSPFPNGVVANIKCTPVHTGTTTTTTGMFPDYAVEAVTASGFTYRKCSATNVLTGFYWVAKGF